MALDHPVVGRSRASPHLFQGRYKSILCQTDRYLGELVRYIHLNPARARMVKRPEDYEYSGWTSWGSSLHKSSGSAIRK